MSRDGDRAVLFPADAYWNAERGRWTAAIRGTKGSHQTSEGPVSPSASTIANSGSLLPHSVPRNRILFQRDPVSRSN